MLHDDPDVLVVAKPAGLPVLPGGGFLQHTLLGQLQQRYPKDTPTPVHRLGRGTSGLVLLARSPLAKASLSQQMRDNTQQASVLLHSLLNLRGDSRSEQHSQNCSELHSGSRSKQCSHLDSHLNSHLHSRWYSADDFLEHMPNDGNVPTAKHRPLRKTYLALIGANDLPDRFTITQPIGKLPHPTLGYVYGAAPDGRPAYSEGRVLRREGDRTLLEVTILTGRPHQIRIHLASVGYPLLGDPLYAAGGVPHLAAALPAAKLPVPGDCGYWLHAHQLTFQHPATGEPMRFTSPFPASTSAGDG